MLIGFKTTKLKKLLSDERQLGREYGASGGRKIARRLAVLAAAECLADVPTTPPTRRHQLKGDLDEQFAVDVEHPYRLLFKPDHTPVPRCQDGGIDLTKVTAITILGVEDYH
ncbi:MAG: system killer suppression protein [Tistrella sp.]|uniref:System killer suppression protein n=1 Tax=Tistrella mobilis TaxID=171437 RepID=A0A3B9IP62_9PROT|nr:type II toxin-antitoxin system RelE/ParE family toxin [Tistrella sp.]MAD36266.1 system killer suppression protein [Tistrella sp.]MBA78754.1 system killer suppression protein [Tistrella sp.]HAE49488.1 system killer suppression protein [Tistrella mobilis]